jgi:hypothetical protein
MPHYLSLLHIHHPLTILQNQLYITLVTGNPRHKHPHYYSRNTPKHTKGPQNPEAP